jgi:hypothetical protein
MAVGVSAFAPLTGSASSHREAPLVAADPQVDNTDLYAFTSPDAPDTVTLISNWLPFQEPAGGPNFYAFQEGVRYHINIDNDGDGKRDVTYRWVFKNHYKNPNTFLYATGPVDSLSSPNLNFFQTYSLKRIVGRGAGGRPQVLARDVIVAPSDVGKASMPDYAKLRNEAIRSFGAGGGTAKTFAGQADDPFFLDLRLFDLLYGGDFSEAGDDTVAGFNVNSIALQIPKSDLARNGDATRNPIVGVWSTARRRGTQVQTRDGNQTRQGQYVNVSRLGNPLVNEVVIAVKDKDRWNSSRPTQDGLFLNYVTNPELPKLIEAIYGIKAPATPRNDLVAVFLTGVEGLNKPPGVRPSEMIRLNMSIAPCEQGTCAEYSRLGVIGGDNAGYPNGRRLADDALDISLQVVQGELVGNPNDLSDGVLQNDRPFGGTFPYVALPHRGSDPAPHGG